MNDYLVVGLACAVMGLILWGVVILLTRDHTHED